MRLWILPLVLMLTACDALRGPQEPLVDQLRAIEGVVSVAESDPIVVEVDTTLEPGQLTELGREIFDVTNDAGPREGKPEVQIVAGNAVSDLEYLHGFGGPEPGAPNLAWVRYLEGEPVVESAIIHNGAGVQLEDGTDPYAWALSYAEQDLDWPEHGSVSAGSEGDGAQLTFTPGSSQDVELLRVAVDAAASADAHLTQFRYGKLNYDVPDVEHARELITALDAHTDADPDVSMSSPRESWYGKLSALVDQLSGDLGALGDLVAGTVATLVSTAADRGTYTVRVPGLEELEEFIELVGSTQWTPGPDSMVRVEVEGSEAPHPSRLRAANWPLYGPILVDAHRAGLVRTSIREPGGGRREQTFDIYFHNSPGVDLTTADGYGRAVEVLRAHSWEGDAQISISEAPSPVFWSSDTGRADGAYQSRSDADRELSGWTADWVAAWDATAD